MRKLPIRIPLSRGKHALIDADDLPLVSGRRWYVIDTGHGGLYAASWDGGRPLYMHSLILPTPVGITPDHINGNGLDNQRSNLRPATKSQQAANSKLRRNNTSGYRGVCWDKSRGKWVVHIDVRRRRLNLGRYDDKDEAARAYDTAARAHFGEFARVNFPGREER